MQRNLINWDTLLPTHHCTRQVGQGKHGFLLPKLTPWERTVERMMAQGEKREEDGRRVTRMSDDDGWMRRGSDSGMVTGMKDGSLER